MNHPADLFAQAIALAAWNAANQRARDDYHAHPLATHLPNRYFDTCDHCQEAKP